MKVNSDESLQKRNNMRSQKSKTPRSIIDFSKQNRECANGRKSAVTESSQERITSEINKNSRISLRKYGPLQKLVEYQRK